METVGLGSRTECSQPGTARQNPEHWCKQDGASIGTHRWHHTAGADAVIEARPALVIGVLALVQHVLVAAVVGLLVGHPAAALHSDGVAAAEVGLHVGTVTAALEVTALEVPVFVEGDLCEGDCWRAKKRSLLLPLDILSQQCRFYHLNILSEISVS